MATTYTPKFLKRAAPPQSQPEVQVPTAKKIRHDHRQVHKPKWDLQRSQRKDGAKLNRQAVQDMLTRSISLALEAVGFEAADQDAVESLRADTEEYMAHYLADVRQSMLSSRRVQPISQDFLQALHNHQLSLRSLLPHLDPPVASKRSQYSLQTIGPRDSRQERQLRSLGALLNSGGDETATRFIPKHFPNLPSQHTYKSTPEFPDREQDPRKIRERATEEGRLGEEALRKLVGEAAAHPAAEALYKGKVQQTGREKRDQMWRETMSAVSEGEESTSGQGTGMEGIEGGRQKERKLMPLAMLGHVSSAVNYEQKYWRKPVK